MSVRIPHTPPHFSVNRVRIVDLPGLPIDDAVRGQRAVDLLSSWAVIRYARAQAVALELPDAFAQDTRHTRLALPRWVDARMTGLEWLGQGRAPNPDTGRQVLEFMAQTVAQTWTACTAGGQAPNHDVMLCVAAYVQGGRLLGNGLYANLSTLADDARPLLARAIAARVPHAPRGLRVHLIHDGTAACAVHAGTLRAAMILVGTALGIGFPPPETKGLRPLADTLAVC